MEAREPATEVIYWVLAWSVVIAFGVLGVVLDYIDDEPGYVPSEDDRAW